MSDYVTDFDFMDFSPSSLGLDQPTTFDHLDNIDWDQPNYEDLANVDWSALHEEVMGVAVGEPADLLQPGDRFILFPPVMSMVDVAGDARVMPQPANSSTAHASINTPSPRPRENLSCSFEGCRAGPYKRIGDLKRHSRKHDLQRKLDCPAVGCNRIGQKGFSRNDKLTDHILAGHDEDTPFSCDRCGEELTRDLLAVHTGSLWERRNFSSLYRTCPMLRCSFKVHTGHYYNMEGRLERLQHHLLKKHDTKERTHYHGLLRQKSYDAQTCEIACPICPAPCQFPTHDEFHGHFMQVHFHGPLCVEHVDASCELTCDGRRLHLRFKNCFFIPEEVRQHRRAILRVWPHFRAHPVWFDMRCQDRRN